MFTTILSRLALCVLIEVARQGLPVVVKYTVRHCLKRKRCSEVQRCL